jgi:2-polyprenyl-3-methyl-5-hydroxy-6-metoxy-1,4-benzoquinol methylase
MPSRPLRVAGRIGNIYKMKPQKDYFNERAHTWDEKCPHDMRKVGDILDLLGIREGHRILDAGTGTGVLVPGLSARVSLSGHVKAVDLAEKMIDIARRKNIFLNVSFECTDALETGEGEALYDHIICYSMFPHFQEKAEAVRNLAGKLKTGGKLAICHSQGRRAINLLHERSADTVTFDALPDMRTLKNYFLESGLAVDQEIDTEEMFVLTGCKEPQTTPVV